MTKQEFKTRMSAYRNNLSMASRRGIDAFISASKSDSFCAQLLRPRCKPVVSRNVMLHLFSAGGLDAVRHIDSVEIRYN